MIQTATRWTPSSLPPNACRRHPRHGWPVFHLAATSSLARDFRFMAIPEDQMEAVRPGLHARLTQVFRVLGRYVLGTSVPATTLASTAYKDHRTGAVIGVLMGGAASIGLPDREQQGLEQGQRRPGLLPLADP